jgi:hypothetical protein
VVVIGGTRSAPRLLARERVTLADERLAGSKQPYHAIEALPLPEARAQLAALESSAARLAAAAIGQLVQIARAAGIEPCAAGILDSAGRRGATLEAILASHALIHTADGNHFREALNAGCAVQGLPVVRIRQRDLAREAAAGLRRAPRALTATLTQLGRAAGPPWGADQKAAALIAWLLLARGV